MADLKRKYNSNEIVVNNKSNFKSHLVKSQCIMDNIHFDEVVLLGMGKATSRVINLALQLNANNYNTFELKTSTYSVEVREDKRQKRIIGAEKDNFDPDNVDINRPVSYVAAIKVVVRKNKLELDKIRHSRNKHKSVD